MLGLAMLDQIQQFSLVTLCDSILISLADAPLKAYEKATGTYIGSYYSRPTVCLAEGPSANRKFNIDITSFIQTPVRDKPDHWIPGVGGYVFFFLSKLFFYFLFPKPNKICFSLWTFL